jgi:DNA-binding MarR family transcriptional regulator
MSDRPSSEPLGAAFLLVQIGFLGARRFAARLAPIGLEPRQFGLLRSIEAVDGQSQQALSGAIGIHPSKLVGLVDDLEQRGFVERQRSRDDRRANMVSLTVEGRRVLALAREAAADHADDLLGSLDQHERDQLAELLDRIAKAHDLRPSTMPGRP